MFFNSYAPENAPKGSEGERPTFFGLEYEELQYYHDTASSDALKLLTRAALRWMDFCMSLQEPERKGHLARFVQSRYFVALTAGMIIANAIFMLFANNEKMTQAIDGSTSADAFQLAEHVFLGLYVLEVLLKLIVHRLYFFINSDFQWNSLDFILVALAVADIFVTLMGTSEPGGSDLLFMRAMRILRLAKVLRLLRIMRVFDTLRVMLSSMIGSVVSLLWSLVMMGFVYYFFALMFVQNMAAFLLERGHELDPSQKQDVMDNFGGVLLTMLTLLKATTGGDDWGQFMTVLLPTGWVLPMLFVFFMCFVNISLLNILTAVFIEKAMRLAEPSTVEQAREQQREDCADMEELRRMLGQMDEDGSGTVSAQEFRSHLECKEMRCCFGVLGLNILDAQEFFEMLAFSSETEEVSIDSFVHGCMLMRGSATGIAQQKLIMQASIMRREQKEAFRTFSERLDAISGSTAARPNS